MYIEITDIPPLSARERTLLEAHTLLNLYQVLRVEIMHLGDVLAGDERLLAGAIGMCDEVIAGLDEPETLAAIAPQVDEQERRVFAELDAELRSAAEHGPGVGESVANLRSLFAMLRARSRESAMHRGAPDRWVSVPIAVLEAEFRDVFAAIEQNSHGRFRIVFNRAIQRTHDYFIEFAVEPRQERAVTIPAVLPDVLRDLVANARKYTAPGGRIRALLRSDDEGVRLTVEDSGRGIPPNEITRVVHFGVRGSNVSDVRAMGGGFGLTKAFVVAKRFGGRLWIDSQPGAGTKVRIWLPPPPARPLISQMGTDEEFCRRTSGTPCE